MPHEVSIWDDEDGIRIIGTVEADGRIRDAGGKLHKHPHHLTPAEAAAKAERMKTKAPKPAP